MTRLWVSLHLLVHIIHSADRNLFHSAGDPSNYMTYFKRAAASSTDAAVSRELYLTCSK